MGKKCLLLVFFLALMLIPSNVFAMSNKEAANKMNNYIKDAIFNNKWKVTNSKSNSSNYDIKIKFTNTNNSTFKEVISKIPTKLFDSNSYKVKAYLFDCGSGSCSEDAVKKQNTYITFYMAKTSSSNIYLYASNVAPSVYEKVTDGSARYEISTNQKGVGGDVTKKGKATFSSSQQHDETQVDRAVGTLTNPQIIGNNATISLPAKNSSFWKGKTDQCYYFKVNFNSSNNMARYELSPVANQSYQINYIIDGSIAGTAFRDALDTKLYGLSKNNLYGICLYATATDENFYGKKVTFTFKDTENINVGNGFDADLAEEQLGESNVNEVDANPFSDNNKEWEKIDGTISSKDFNNPAIGCDSIFSKKEGTIGWMLNTVLNYIKILGPVLVVLLSAVDFIKAVVGFDEKAMKEAQNKLIIRLVAALALFLVPTLVQLLLSFINMTTCTI